MRDFSAIAEFLVETCARAAGITILRPKALLLLE